MAQCSEAYRRTKQCLISFPAILPNQEGNSVPNSVPQMLQLSSRCHSAPNLWGRGVP